MNIPLILLLLLALSSAGAALEQVSVEVAFRKVNQPMVCKKAVGGLHNAQLEDCVNYCVSALVPCDAFSMNERRGKCVVYTYQAQASHCQRSPAEVWERVV